MKHALAQTIETLTYWLMTPTGRLLILLTVFSAMAFAQVAAPWDRGLTGADTWFDTEFTKIAAFFIAAIAIEWKLSAHAGVLAGTALTLVVLGCIHYRYQIAAML